MLNIILQGLAIHHCGDYTTARQHHRWTFMEYLWSSGAVYMRRRSSGTVYKFLFLKATFKTS